MYCGLLAQLNAMVKSRLLPLYLPHAALFRQAVRISPESDVLTNETLPVVHQTSRAHEQVSCPTVWQRYQTTRLALYSHFSLFLARIESC